MTCNKISPCRGGLYFSDTFCIDFVFFNRLLHTLTHSTTCAAGVAASCVFQLVLSRSEVKQ